MNFSTRTHTQCRTVLLESNFGDDSRWLIVIQQHRIVSANQNLNHYIMITGQKIRGKQCRHENDIKTTWVFQRGYNIRIAHTLKTAPREKDFWKVWDWYQIDPTIIHMHTRAVVHNMSLRQIFFICWRESWIITRWSLQVEEKRGSISFLCGILLIQAFKLYVSNQSNILVAVAKEVLIFSERQSRIANANESKFKSLCTNAPNSGTKFAFL